MIKYGRLQKTGTEIRGGGRPPGTTRIGTGADDSDFLAAVTDFLGFGQTTIESSKQALIV